MIVPKSIFYWHLHTFWSLNRVQKQLKMTRTCISLFAFNEKDVDAVRDLKCQDARYTVDELAMSSGINSSAVFTVLEQ